MTILVRVKGGAGSGNWGHAGRPGLVGGSGGTGGGGIISHVRDLQGGDYKGYFIRKDGMLVDINAGEDEFMDHTRYLIGLDDPSVLNMSEDALAKFTQQPEVVLRDDVDIFAGAMDGVFDAGNVRVRAWTNPVSEKLTTVVESPFPINNRTMKKVQNYILDGKLPKADEYVWGVWKSGSSSHSDSVSFSYQDIMRADSVRDLRVSDKELDENDNLIFGSKVARQWEPIVDDFSKVMKMVHLAMRRDPVDVEQIYAEIFREKRDAYEDGMTIQAANAGCPGRRGTTPPDVMKEMSAQAHTEAAGIANTYNYDLALSIRAIRVDVPKANRFTYAKRLAAWEATRDEWKSKQISLWNQMQWQDRATADFLSHNPQINKGWARVEPRGRAVCKICQYWVKRGRVELSETRNQKWPAHLNCPHYWDTHPKGKVNCDELWLGAPIREWWEKEVGSKGGAGSGNWGHAGRPGLVGGSGGTGGVGIERQGVMQWFRDGIRVGGVSSYESKDVPDKVVEKLMGWAENHDSRVLRHMDKVYVARDKEAWASEHRDAFGHADNPEYTSGWTSGNKIYIRPGGGRKDTFDHEMGHVAWNASGTRSMWADAYGSDPKFDRHTEYSRRGGRAEGFAEAYMSYVAKGGQAKSARYAATYAAVEDVINGIR